MFLLCLYMNTLTYINLFISYNHIIGLLENIFNAQLLPFMGSVIYVNYVRSMEKYIYIYIYIE